ncbi:sugar phosphate isomerase/epimerase [candidate division KSB1 bacterium]|nr:sugar phosphate isomerase/epimerase [candidate division KSB1 bacterium]
MQIGLTLSEFNGKKPSELLALVRQFGVNFVEFNPTVFGDLSNVIPHMTDVASGFHLPLVAEHGYDFTQPDAKEKIDEAIYLINQHRLDLNLLYCVAHPPEAKDDNESIEEALEFLLENLVRLEAPVILENIETWSQGDFDRLAKVFRSELRKQSLGLCFDPAHAFLRGENIFERYSEIAQYVRCIHLSDCAKGHDAHLPLGQGEMPISDFLRHVAKSGYDGIINLEVVPSSLQEIKAVVSSYMQVLRVFKKVKYVSTATKLLFSKPKLRH